MKIFDFEFRHLSTQLIASFVAVVLLTAIAAWIPEVGLIRDQLDDQAWAQVEQGRRTTQASYRSWQSEVENAAILVAQLPSLHDLFENGTIEEQTTYLNQLRSGLEADVIAVCTNSQLTAVEPASAVLVSDEVCTLENTSTYHVTDGDSAPQAWFFSGHVVPTNEDDSHSVIMGTVLDDAFLEGITAQTGLEHTLLVDGQPIATSIAGGIARWSTSRHSVHSPDVDGIDRNLVFYLDEHPYYSTRFDIQGSRIEDEVSLSVADLATTKRRLLATVTLSILLVAVIGSTAGIVLAWRIGKPLTRLADAAASFSDGQLETPVPVDTGVHETELVAHALEQARLDLRRTLADLHKEKAWIEHLLEAIVEGIVTLDARGRVTYFSAGAEHITGWDRDAVVGRTCNDVFQPAEAEERFSELMPPPGQRRKISVLMARGQQAMLSVTHAPLVPPDAGEAHIALVFRDVTEEEAIQRLLGHFLANITHEFRTPLSALEASIELLLDAPEDLSPDELERLLVSLQVGILNLQRLVDNLLESASLEAGRFHVSPRPTDLAQIIADATQMMQPLLSRHGQQLVVELPAAVPIVRADPPRTVQVLVNLLSNASKYGPDDADIVIGASVEDGWARVTVTDQGPGISPEYKDDLFRRFARYETDENAAEYGTGLGLWIVKAIVDAHGGEVGIQSPNGDGTTFWFSLPMVAEQ